VWQPCELLYTCYLLTYLLTFGDLAYAAGVVSVNRGRGGVGDAVINLSDAGDHIARRSPCILYVGAAVRNSAETASCTRPTRRRTDSPATTPWILLRNDGRGPAHMSLRREIIVTDIDRWYGMVNVD